LFNREANQDPNGSVATKLGEIGPTIHPVKTGGKKGRMHRQINRRVIIVVTVMVSFGAI
jgi:hypothetical protein